MIGRSVQEVFGEDYYGARKDAYAHCLAGTTCEFENVSVHEGEQSSMTSSHIPHVANGEVIGMYVLSVDTTAAHLYQRELNLLAHTDVMTGLPNRRHYEERLADTLQRARRSNSPAALLFLDIDRFKGINDTLGHAAGDAVLKEFGKRLLASVRQSDSVARLAGDEFTIILDNVGSAQILPLRSRPRSWRPCRRRSRSRACPSA
jgi:GGDEF domain-containing protein